MMELSNGDRMEAIERMMCHVGDRARGAVARNRPHMCGTRGEAQAIDEVAVYSVGQQLSLCCSSKKVKFC